MTEEEKLEELYGSAFAIVGQAGEAKAHAYEALSLAEEGKFIEAELAMKECEKAFIEAHKSQTELIQREVGGERIKLSILLIHAQDHLMTALAERELIKRFIKTNKRLYALENSSHNSSASH